METVELSTQQSLRIAELPEDYRVVGVDGRAPLVRKPTGQVRGIQSGRSTAAMTEAKLRLADRGADEGDRDRLDASWAATPYKSLCG